MLAKHLPKTRPVLGGVSDHCRSIFQMIGTNRVVPNLRLAQSAFDASRLVNVRLLVNRMITGAPLFAHDNRFFLVGDDGSSALYLRK